MTMSEHEQWKINGAEIYTGIGRTREIKALVCSDEATGLHIVKCVNTHDALIEAAEAVLALRPVNARQNLHRQYQENHDTWNNLKATIEAAKKGA